MVNNNIRYNLFRDEINLGVFDSSQLPRIGEEIYLPKFYTQTDSAQAYKVVKVAHLPHEMKDLMASSVVSHAPDIAVYMK